MLADNNYKYFIAALLDHRNDFAEGKTLNQKQQFYNNIGKNLAGKTKYYFQGKYLIKALKNKEFDLFEINFADFSRENPYYEYTDALQEVYGYHARLSNGAVAPDFLASDTKGSMHNLQDYRGKVVYLSFWASWCQPCIENFKQTYHLKEELEREGVLFVNVSLDKENNTWETALRQYPIEGINLLANNKDEINRLYGFSTIPAYFLIDKNGKFRIIDNVRLDYAYDTVLRLTNE
ncbi:MAG: redoxin domain-containing protein [Chitinophagales bacterium]